MEWILRAIADEAGISCEEQITALQRDEFCALLEERIAPIRLEVEIVPDGGRESLVGFAAQVLFREG